MDLKTILSDSGRTSKFPTVITDEAFTVSFFNGAAEKLIPGITAGHRLEEYVTIRDKQELKRSKYPSSALIGCKDKSYFCAFCPVISGFNKECVFTIAVPDGNEYDDCEHYLTMKLAIISKCLGNNLSGAPAGKERAYNKLYSLYEAYMRMLIAMGGEDYPAAINIKELLEDAFSYYGTVKYGPGSAKRYDVHTNDEYIRLRRSSCILLVCAYDICITLSRNGFCAVDINSENEDGNTSFLFSVRPKHKLATLVEASEETEDAVYSLLGREAENILLIKTLARQIRGQAEMKYDVLSDEFDYEVTVPVERTNVVKSRGTQFADAVRAAADMCLSIKGKA